MGKVKHLKGLTIIALLLILLGLVSLFSSFYHSYILQYMLQNIPDLIYSILYGLTAIVIGIGIFTLKSWARIAAIVLIAIKTTDVTYRSIIDILRWGEGLREFQINYFVFSSLLLIIAIGWGVIIVYYLTRPKVKAQFNLSKKV